MKEILESLVHATRAETVLKRDRQKMEKVESFMAVLLRNRFMLRREHLNEVPGIIGDSSRGWPTYP